MMSSEDVNLNHFAMSPNGLHDAPPLVGGGNCACNYPCHATERSEATTKGSGVGSIELIGGSRGESYQLNGYRLAGDNQRA
jgi:hypothetical protein